MGIHFLVRILLLLGGTMKDFSIVNQRHFRLELEALRNWDLDFVEAKEAQCLVYKTLISTA